MISIVVGVAGLEYVTVCRLSTIDGCIRQRGWISSQSECLTSPTSPIVSDWLQRRQGAAEEAANEEKVFKIDTVKDFYNTGHSTFRLVPCVPAPSCKVIHQINDIGQSHASRFSGKSSSAMHNTRPGITLSPSLSRTGKFLSGSEGVFDFLISIG